MNTLTNEAIKSRIEALKNSHAQNNNAVTSTYLMDAKAFEELLSLRAKLASVNANCDKAIITGIVDRYQKDTANYALVNRCAALEVQLAELRGQEPVAWIVGSEEIDEFKRGREVTVMRDGDEEELEKIALYIRPVPPAASKPDAMLCDFYEVGSYPALVQELVKHVEQLQEAAKRDVKPWQDTFPETLLPAYIERIKNADDAVRAASQPYTVPDEWSLNRAWEIDGLDKMTVHQAHRAGYEQCRAAMLQPEIKVETDNTTQQFESLSEPPTSR